ncbi:unnamed protein product [Mytilus coruscus]|uniref:TRPM SLOG domain-containing protein n=1 Tax=Mytilus coruscus TaxID=42192 RepID=A0A6J8CRF3_MYTCO|nr:unnamed protein product [Mytilus coruscus]
MNTNNPRCREKIEIIVNQPIIKSEDVSPILSKLEERLVAADGNDNCFPGLVLSVIGDSESYVPKPWNTIAFTSGLLQSIQGVKKSWVIYRGKTGGISKLIYDAFREPKDETNEKFNKNTIIAIRPAKKNEKISKMIRKKLQGNTNGSTDICANFGKLSAEYTPLLSKEQDKVVIKMRVPVLMIAVEGDKNTIHQIKVAVMRNIPVLLIKGSGKAVDFIIEYLEESRPMLVFMLYWLCNWFTMKNLKKRDRDRKRV